MTALDLTARWPVANVSAGVVSGGSRSSTTIGDTSRPFALASVTKPLVAWAVLVATEEGVVGLTTTSTASVSPAARCDTCSAMPEDFRSRDVTRSGRPSAFGATPTAASRSPPKRSQRAAAMAMADYLDEAVLQPLAMGCTTLAGSPAHDATRMRHRPARRSSVEMRSPTLISAATRDAAFVSTYPG